MYKCVIRNDFNENIIDMTFMITNKCNYSCTYCIEKIPQTKTIGNFLDLNKAINFVKKYIEQYKNTINIRLYGGEPTLHPGLLEFCKELNSIQQINIIEIFTNFSLDYTLYKNLLYLDKLELFTSYHSSNIMSEKEYLSKVLKICKEKEFTNKLTFNIMLENNVKDAFDNTYNLYKNIIKICNQTKFQARVELVPLFSTTTYNSIYNKNKFKIFKFINNKNNIHIDFTLTDYDNNITHESKVVGYDAYNFKNWLCSSGKNAIFIDSYGYVFPCGGLYTKRNKIYSTTKLNNIFYNDMKTIFKNTICPHNDCVLCVPMKVLNVNNTQDSINNTDIKYKIV